MSNVLKRPKTNRLWRYMNIERFESLIKTGSLYFAKPSQFEDGNEGMLSLNWQTITAYFDEGIEEHERFVSRFPEFAAPPYISLEDYMNYFLDGREDFGVSCWHTNKTQSLAMWNLYVGKDKDGIAITTTFDKLCSVLTPYNDNLTVGAVGYSDLMEHSELSFLLKERPKKKTQYNEEASMKPLNSLFLKDYLYEHEKEVRAVIELVPKYGGNQNFKIDLSKLIDKIIISPYSSEEFVEKIKIILEENNLSSDLIYFQKTLQERRNIKFERDGKYIFRKRDK